MPKEERHKLRLTLTALFEINGHCTPRAIRTFDNVVEVNVTQVPKAKRTSGIISGNLNAPFNFLCLMSTRLPL